MEENITCPTEVNSFLVNNVFNTVYASKKRKFRAEHLGLRFPKHICSNQRRESDPSSDWSPDSPEVYKHIINNDIYLVDIEGESGSEHANDSCSLPGDSGFFLSTSNEAKSDAVSSGTCFSDQPSTSSFSSSSSCSTSMLNSFNSTHVTKSVSHKTESSCNSEEHLCPHHNSGCHLSNYEDHLLEFETYAVYSCSECGTNGIEQYMHNELDGFLYSNGVAPDSYVLSSGRWSVNQDTSGSTSKLTIDKEFEEYFSMLML